MDQLKQALLRIEVPFCVRPCGWRPSCQVIAGWNSKRQHDYLQAVCREIEANALEFDDFEFTAVRLGGGIASMGGEDIAMLTRCIHSNLSVQSDAPITMRSSIANISGATMTWFKRAGITRYDFEMMSLIQQNFTRLNKTDNLHDFEMICDYILRAYSNDLLGLVLAYGMEADSTVRTIQNMRDSILKALDAHASHIVLLEYKGERRASDETCEAHLVHARELLGEAGFNEYLPLYFARGNKERDTYFASRAAGTPELAFGLGARTCIDGVLSVNTSDLQIYLEHSADYTRITESVEPCIQPQGNPERP